MLKWDLLKLLLSSSTSASPWGLMIVQDEFNEPTENQDRFALTGPWPSPQSSESDPTFSLISDSMLSLRCFRKYFGRGSVRNLGQTASEVPQFPSFSYLLSMTDLTQMVTALHSSQNLWVRLLVVPHSHFPLFLIWIHCLTYCYNESPTF